MSDYMCGTCGTDPRGVHMTHERTDEDIIRSGLEDTLDPDYHWAALDRLVARLAQAEQERDEARAERNAAKLELARLATK
jgi:hypothetical protein